MRQSAGPYDCVKSELNAEGIVPVKWNDGYTITRRGNWSPRATFSHKTSPGNEEFDELRKV